MVVGLLLVLVFGARSASGVGILQDQISSQGNALVPALFVFGDSVLDAGTNSLFPSLLQANFKPYGMEYFGKPTGRFSNGRTYADFIATYVGLPLVEPYLKPKGQWSLIKGVNYASAGSGLLRSSNAANKVIPFPDQILQFGQTKLQIEKTLGSTATVRELFSASLFLINIGGNDLFGYLFDQSVPQQVFFNGLFTILKDSIKVLYEAGARKLMFVGLGPVGCVPGVLAVSGVKDAKCIEAFNDITRAYNAAFEQFVYKLPETFTEIKSIFGKPYDKLHDMLYNGNSYGFTAGVTACCGSGIYNGEVQCGRPADLIINPKTNLCVNVSEHVFWDYYHLTDKVNSLVAEELWCGNSSVAPVNLKTLLSSQESLSCQCTI